MYETLPEHHERGEEVGEVKQREKPLKNGEDDHFPGRSCLTTNANLEDDQADALLLINLEPLPEVIKLTCPYPTAQATSTAGANGTEYCLVF
jgi:hypothetical protein